MSRKWQLTNGLIGIVALVVAWFPMGCISDANFTELADSGLFESLAGALDSAAANNNTGSSSAADRDSSSSADDSPGASSGSTDSANSNPAGNGVTDDNPSSDDLTDDNSADGNSSSDDTGAGGTGSPADVRLETRLSGTGLESGSAEYRVVDGRRRFKVEVEDFAPGTYGIAINGVEIAQITVGPSGIAEVEFDSSVEPGHTPLPANFPGDVVSGDTVTVDGIVSGTF